MSCNHISVSPAKGVLLMQLSWSSQSYPYFSKIVWLLHCLVLRFLTVVPHEDTVSLAVRKAQFIVLWQFTTACTQLKFSCSLKKTPFFSPSCFYHDPPVAKTSLGPVCPGFCTSTAALNSLFRSALLKRREGHLKLHLCSLSLLAFKLEKCCIEWSCLSLLHDSVA